MRRIGRFFLILLALVGLLTMTLLGGGLYLGLKAKPESLPQRIVLDLDLDRGVTEAESDNPLAQFEKRRPYVLRRLVETLERAATDGRVVGVMARLSHGNLGMARTQELRDAIAVFRKSGKPTVLFADTLGEFGPATLDAYLASAFGQIWLQPSGDVGLTGFVVESPFLRELFDKLGIKPQFAHRGEYKSAIEIFTNSRWSEPARESYQAMLESWSRQVVDGIAASRNLAPEAVRTIVDRSPLTAQEAREAGLVDKLGYYDEAKASIVTGDAKLVDPERYLNRLGSARSEARIAIIYGTGPVQRGQEAEFGLLDKSSGMYSQSIAKAFHDAIEDRAIKAIVFRIDSPGGSYVASDTIWHEVRRARAAGKPVIASMGDVAASGGYFAAMGADKIVAQPATITGSIGVFSGKIALADFWKTLGITWDEVHRGDQAAMWSVNREFSPEAWRRMDVLLDRIYADFTGKAAEGRNLSAEAVEKAARGRIWTGGEAKALGLVDELGGLSTALKLARQAASLPAEGAVELVRYPKPKDVLHSLKSLLAGSRAPIAIEAEGLRDLTHLAALARPLLRRVEAARGGELRAPDLTP